MVKKFIAYYKSGSEIKSVNVYKALSMRNSRINNKDDIIEFWDTPDLKNADKVFPKRSSNDGKAAHFSYYPGSTHAGVYREMTMTHKIYEMIYSEADKILLNEFGNQVIVFIKKSQFECFYRTSNNLYYIDVMLELDRTEPASYYYKWNGKLALEIHVTHKVEKSKINDLTENGIQLFQMKIYDNQRVPEDINSEEQFEYYKRIIKKKIENNNYKIVGKYLNNVLPEPGSCMEERYNTLADFEREEQILQEEILKNEKIISVQKEQIKNNEISLNTINEKIEKTSLELKKNEDIIRAAEKNYGNNLELTKLVQKHQDIISQLKNDLNKEKSKGFLKKLFGR